MMNLEAGMRERTSPFQFFHGYELLAQEDIEQLAATSPTSAAVRIAVDDPEHEKQYRMNLFRLVEGDEEAPADSLPAPWKQLRGELMSEEFTAWMERQTGIELHGLLRSVGVYAHRNGDFLAVHKDKPTKAITCILYLNRDWPAEAGGRFQMFATGERGAEPVEELSPVGGQLFAFPPTDHSWHAVSEITHPDDVERLTVQVEYWLTTEQMGSTYDGSEQPDDDGDR